MDDDMVKPTHYSIAFHYAMGRTDESGMPLDKSIPLCRDFARHYVDLMDRVERVNGFRIEWKTYRNRVNTNN